jgi:hypothetical protein
MFLDAEVADPVEDGCEVRLRCHDLRLPEAEVVSKEDAGYGLNANIATFA